MLSPIIRALSKTQQLMLLTAVVFFGASGALKANFYYLDNTEVVKAEGGEYREGITNQPVFINPVIPTTEADREIARLVFGSFYDISDGIKRSDDGKIWTVRIKEDWKWHDGERVTSDDVIFTLETIQNKEAHSYLYPSFQGVKAERISELEIKFTLQTPYAFFEEEHLRNLMVIPKHIFGDSPVQNLKLSSYGLKPVGFGPYKIDGFTHDDRGVIKEFKLTANNDYPGETANISKFVFKFYKSEEELVDAYNAGLIDGFGLSTGENFSDQGDDKTVKIRHSVHNLKSSRNYAIFINQALGSKELKKPAVRNALSRSVDRQALVDGIFNSYAVPIYGPTAQTGESTATYNPALLKDLQLNMTVPEESFLVKTAEEIKIGWEKLGAKVNLSVLSLKDIQEKVLKNTDYELLMFGNIAGASQDLFSFWHSSRRFYPDQNLSLLQNKKVDTMLEDYRKNLNETTRTERLKNISDAIAAEVPAVFLYSPDYIYVSTPNLGGFDEGKIINISADRFSDVKDWYVVTKRVWKQI